MVGKSVVAAFAAIAISHAATPPALPFLDWKACPFEGCAYRRWTAREPVRVYDSWKTGRRRIALLSKGETVVGITGLVITLRPGLIRMDRDLPEQSLTAGDRILTYTYRGEGFPQCGSAAGTIPPSTSPSQKGPDGSGCGGTHCAATYVDLCEKVWWAQVRLKSGRTGWVNMNSASLNGIDLLAFLRRGSDPA